jgi:acyl-CoA synthetase (AMP-forming)/AMP-acid ligase II
MTTIKQEYDAAVAELCKAGAPFELEQRKHKGREYTAYKNAPDTLIALLNEARAHGDKDFLVYEGERHTFAQAFAAADALANALHEDFGVGVGDRVAIAMRNYPEWIIGFLAIALSGATAVPLNSWGQKAEIEYGLTDSEAKIVLADKQRLSFICDDLDTLGVRAIAVRADAELLANQRVYDLEELIEAHAGKPVPTVSVSSDDQAIMLYTSGTTGKPKGAMTSHIALTQGLYNFDMSVMACAMTNPDAIQNMMAKGFDQAALLAVPLFHLSGLHSVFLTALRAGRKIVMMYKWDAETAVSLIEQERLTILSLVPSMLREIVSSPSFDTTDTSSLFNVGAGGAAGPPKLTATVAEKVDNPYPGAGWGLTETNTSVSSFSGKATVYRPGSAGFLAPIMELKVRDDTGQALPQGEPGVLWVKTISLIDGYWNRPEANAEDFSDGWFNTGDIGYIDNEGFVFLSDRAKDLIIRAGENIYPAEIEAVFYHHPAVQEAAVFAVPDDKLGEEAGACVVVKKGQHVDEKELRELLHTHLAKFKVPRYIWFQPEPLPRNPSGKLLKKQLRERYASA